jgi:hypothetical protein
MGLDLKSAKRGKWLLATMVLLAEQVLAGVGKWRGIEAIAKLPGDGRVVRVES